MKVNHSFEFTDEQRARIRAGLGRAGVATRREIRIWIALAVHEAFDRLPQPKSKRRSKPDRPASDDTGPETLSRYQRAKAAPEHAVCRHCRTPKANHGLMSFTCPPRPGAPRGRMFEPIEEAATA